MLSRKKVLLNSHILIVEDNPDMQQLYKEFLLSTDFAFTISKSAEEALKFFPIVDFDLIVTDFDLPGMNGLQMVENIRSINGTIPVIMVSGSIGEISYNDINRLYILEIIQKPLSKTKLSLKHL